MNRLTRDGDKNVYKRCAGFGVEVDMATHAEFLRLLKLTTATWSEAYETVRQALAGGKTFKEIPIGDRKLAGPKLYWSKTLEVGAVRSAKGSLPESGQNPGDPEYVAVMAAAGRALLATKPDTTYGIAPRPWWTGETPPGMTVRHTAGLHNLRPLRQSGAELMLRDGTVLRALDPLPKNCAEAAYLEFAHMKQTWRVRLVFLNSEPAI